MLNIAYGSDERNKLDVYLPEGRTNATKVLVLIHGGAWISGTKEDMNFVVDKIKTEWPEAAIVNIGYRLANGTTVTYEQINQDIDKAIQYIVANADNWSVSQDLALIGGSAGAHLALLYAYKYDTDNHVKAVVDVFGPAYFADWELYNSFSIFYGGEVKEVYKQYTGTYWDTELYESLSPFHIVNASNYKPTIIFHGTLDPIVPLYHSQYFAGKLSSLGLDYEYYEYPGEYHGFTDPTMNDYAKKAVAFLKSKM